MLEGAEAGIAGADQRGAVGSVAQHPAGGDRGQRARLARTCGTDQHQRAALLRPCVVQGRQPPDERLARTHACGAEIIGRRQCAEDFGGELALDAERRELADHLGFRR